MLEISETEIKLTRLFSDVVGYMPLIAFDMGDAVAFLVSKEGMGKAIGKGGKTVALLSKKLHKPAFVFSDADNIEDFVKNLFSNVSILNIDVVDIMGEKTVNLLISEKDKAKALGKGKARLRAAKEMLKQRFNAELNLRSKVIA
ncbi:MAG: hypothetical protein D6769_00075 [Methanobacteriota archaeon]|nr:MAG: hypothetical protein D6769_00075 [Euryarchaeota archaeon]